MKRFNAGGTSDYEGDDPIVKYRMGMIDAKGNDLTKKSEPEFETKTGENEAISKIPGLREKAMKSVAEGGQKDAPVVATKKVVTTVAKPAQKSDAKSVQKSADKPTQKSSIKSEWDDLSPISLPKRSVVMKPEENKPKPRSPGQMLREESEFTIKPPMQDKGERLIKDAGLTFKSGGKIKSASARADGCAIRGKTRA